MRRQSSAGLRRGAIERHHVLARAAQQRLDALGFGNVEVHVGDGTTGWPEAALFDAIVVAAGGSDVPEALRQQLGIGGRLVIPVGEADNQKLLKITRRDGDRFEEEDRGWVRFVPLIGERGWAETARG